MKIFLTACLMAWLAIIGAGTFYLYNYENTPGTDASATHPAEFPSASRIRRDRERPTLLLFAHPHCPCTRATVAELSKLMTETQGRLSAHVLFIKPAGTSEDWNETALWKSAAAIPGVEVSQDEEEREATLFNAQTSGIALLYDAAGALQFQGGITASRGHEGDNAGRSAILDFVTKETAARPETYVYGCPLRNAENCPPPGDEENR